MLSAAPEMFATRRVATSRDVDHARHVLSEVFLPLDLPSARSTTVVDLKLNALKVGRVTCGYMSFRDAVKIETIEPANYHVDIPTTGRATMRAGLGKPVDGTPQTAGIFMPGRPVTIDSDEQFAQIALMFPREDLDRELADLVGTELSRPLAFPGEIEVERPGAQAMMQVLRSIDEASSDAHGLLGHPLATQRLEQVLIHSLLFAQPHNHSAALNGPVPTAGQRPISRAVELLRSSPDHPWTASELASAVSLSVRSLQEGFRRALDTTPMSYLRRVRLERVRDELVAASPGVLSVTEVAMRWGFVHLGRFATTYREAYGELPSETIRAARGSRRLG